MIIAENLPGFLRGEMTWAQVEGLTAEQATRFMQVGVMYMNAGRFDDALRMFTCLTAVNPKDADAHALRGTALQAQERPEAAIESFDLALAINPKHVVALAARGELRRKLGDELGIDDLKRAAEQDPMGKTSAGQRAAKLVRALTFRPARTATR